MEAKLRPARDALAANKFFDGVQAVNAALEAFEDQLRAGNPDLEGVEKMLILRTPHEFLNKAMTEMTDEQKRDAAQGYALRADLLVGLGAAKRAVVDLSAALLLLPGDAALEQRKRDAEAKIAGVVEVNEEKEKGKIPTTIITGFLGAGKTTLLNHILSVNHGKRIAVIENEFGEVGIDDALLQLQGDVTEENIIEMNNGCICCTVRGDLIAGLKKLVKQSVRKQKPLDGVIIETTGLADPAPVAQTFFADEWVQSHMALDGILTVVDAKHIMEHVREVKPEGVVNESVEQIAFADRLLLNKTDLVEPSYLDELELEIKAINKNVTIRRTQNSIVDMDFILGIKAFSLDKVLELVQSDFLEEEEHGHGHGHESSLGHGHDDGCAGCDDASHGHGHGHGHGHDCDEKDCGDPAHGEVKGSKKRHVHDYRVSSVGITLDQEVHNERLDAFIGWLMKDKGADLYRSKGVLAVQGMKQKFVFQAVHMQFSGKPQQEWKDGEKRCCKMVFIGKNLDRKELNDKFAECLVK